MMTYIKNMIILSILFVSLLSCGGCFDWAPESWWWASVDIDNQSNTKINIKYKAVQNDIISEQAVEAKSILKSTISARRSSEEDILSDNFDYILVLTIDGEILIELVGNEMDRQISENGKDNSADKYLLIITDEMIEVALADRVENNIVE